MMPTSLYTAPSGSSTGTLIGLGVIAALVAGGLVVRRFTGGASGSAGFNRAAFRRAAREAGLDKDESRFLEEYARIVKISNPDFVFKNQARLDTFFRDVFKAIEQGSDSEADADERKAALFQVRERLNLQQSQTVQVRSSRQLGKNMPLSFLVKGDESYPSSILAVEPGGIAVEPPRDPYGESIKLRRGTKLTCYFYGKGRQGYQFETRVTGWELSGSKEVMVVSHSDAVKALPARRHQRKEIKAPCGFYRVAVNTEKVRGKEKKKAQVEKVRYSGTISDISAGGIGIQTPNPLMAGDFVKIEFSTGGGGQSAFGKVVRMNRLRPAGGMMHIQFVKITRRSLNAILSFVYGYTE